MTVQYVMRATKAGATVYWVVSNAPDMTGIHSGFDPLTLSAITIDCVVNVPTATIGGMITGAAGGDLDGYYANPQVKGLRGIPLASGSPAEGQTLKYTSGTWNYANGNSGTLSPQGNWSGNRAVNQTLALHATGSVAVGNTLWVCAQDPDYLYGKNGACIFSLDVSVTPARLGKVITDIFGAKGQPNKITYGDSYLWAVGWDDFGDQTFGTKFCYQINPTTGAVITSVVVPDCEDVAYDGYSTIAVLGNDPSGGQVGRISLLNSLNPVYTSSNYIQTGTGSTPGDLLHINCRQLATGGVANQFFVISEYTNIVSSGNTSSYVVRIQNGLVTNSYNISAYSSNGSIAYNPINDYVYYGSNNFYLYSYGPLSSSPSIYTAYWNGKAIVTLRLDLNNNKIYALANSQSEIASYSLASGYATINFSTGGSRIWDHRSLPGGSNYSRTFSVVGNTPCLIDYDDTVLRKFTPVSTYNVEIYDNYQNVAPLSDFKIIDLTSFTASNVSGGSLLRLQALTAGNETAAKTLYQFTEGSVSLTNDVTQRLPISFQRSGQGKGAMRIGGAKILTSGARLDTGKTLNVVAGTLPDCIIAGKNDDPYNKMYVTRRGSKDVMLTDFTNNFDGYGTNYNSLRDQIFPLFDLVDGYSLTSYVNENNYPVGVLRTDPSSFITIDNNGGLYGMKTNDGSVTSYPGYFPYGTIKPLENCLFSSVYGHLFTATTDGYIAFYSSAFSIPNNYVDNSAYPYILPGAFTTGFSFTGNFTTFLWTEFPISPSQGRMMWVGTNNGEILIQTDVYYYEPNPLTVQLSVGAGKTVSAIKQGDGYVVYASNREDSFIVMIDPTTLYGTPTMISGTNLHSGKLIDFCFAQGKGWALFDNQDGSGALIPFDLTAGPGFLTALDPVGYTINDIPRHCTKGYQLNKSNHYVYVTAGDKVYQVDATSITGTPVAFGVGGLVDWV